MNGEGCVLHVPLLTIERQFTLSRISSRFSGAVSLAQSAERPRGWIPRFAGFGGDLGTAWLAEVVDLGGNATKLYVLMSGDASQ